MNLPDLLRPVLADRYEVGERLGRGGTAEVFAGVANGTGAPVAIKVLHPDLARALAARRFLREVELLQRLDHPGIVPCLEAGCVEAAPGLELPWMVMPQRGPGTLRSRLAAEPKLPVPEVLRLGRELCAALVHAHARGVLHRDLTPANVLLHEGAAQVTDFGVARAIVVSGGDRLSSTGIVVGSPAYMSPEQARGLPDLGPATDAYSLGAVLYEMLAGEQVFLGNTLQAVAVKHLREAPLDVRILRPEVPAPLAGLLGGLLAKRAADRPELEEVGRRLAGAG